MKKSNNNMVDKTIKNAYLEQLEEMAYPVIKRAILTQEEFNEELRIGYAEAVPAPANENHYLEEVEAMGFPVIKQTRMTQEEFNELLKNDYVTEDDEEYKTLITKKLLKSKKDLAKVS